MVVWSYFYTSKLTVDHQQHMPYDRWSLSSETCELPTVLMVNECVGVHNDYLIALDSLMVRNPFAWDKLTREYLEVATMHG